MMMMMKKQPNTTPPSLGLNKDSQTISKAKPKIRIIHIFAPEIIKTDVQNFRELVQRLTGKPSEKQELKNSCDGKKRFRVPRRSRAHKNVELIRAAGFEPTPFLREKIKGEDEIWSSANSGGSFLGGLPEFDGFMEELNSIPFPVYNPAADIIATI